MLPLEPAPQAIIFDLDGVLLDTEPLYTQAAQSVVAQFGKQYDWSLKSQTMGTDALKGAQVVIDALDLPLTPERYVEQRNQKLLRLFEDTPAMPGAAAWVNTLKRAQVPLAIATSSYSDLCEVKWRKNAWLNNIEIKLYGDDPEITQLKPAPDIYLAAARKLGVSPAACLVFEDSPAGVKAAKNAGMRVIALKAPQLPRELVAQADAIIQSYDEIGLTALSL